jgi:WD40 repeat protein
LQELKSHIDWVCSMVFSPDGTKIASGSDNCSVRIWDAVTGGLLQELKGYTGGVRCVVFSPDGTKIVSGLGDNSIRIWDAAV